jgi:adenosylmethionine-8-amino-7-oxononanoate aminotransferase
MFFTDPARVHPLIQRGDGVYLYDVAGKRYIDGTAGIAVVNVGHGRAEVAQAMKEQAESVAYAAPNIFSNIPAEALASRLGQLTPGDLKYFHFVSGGSEAVEVAMKLARQYFYDQGYLDRYVVLSRKISYHGATMGALSISGYEGRTRKFKPLLLEYPKVEPCYCYRCPFGLEYPGCGVKCAHDLDTVIREVGPGRVSAFIAEPVVGAAGGALVPPPEYFPLIREICDRWGILFIADEVMTGFGRTGKYFAVEHWDAVPDMMTVAKGLSSGYSPMGAVMIGQKLASAFQENPFEHVLTFGAHPVGAAAASAVLGIMERENLASRAASVGGHLLAEMERLLENPMVGDVRGLGLMAGIELVMDKAKRTPFPKDLKVSQRLSRACLDRGLTIYPGSGTAGGAGDHFLLCPPLIMKESEASEVVDILEDATLNVYQEVSSLL